MLPTLAGEEVIERVRPTRRSEYLVVAGRPTSAGVPRRAADLARSLHRADRPSQDHADGTRRRRGPFRPGDRVQLTDPKGRMHTIVLEAGQGSSTPIGRPRARRPDRPARGPWSPPAGGTAYLALRPLLADFVLSMPRGAAVIYPKDAAQIVADGRRLPGRPGARGRGRLGRADLLAAARGGRRGRGDLATSCGRISPRSPARNVEAFFGGAAAGLAAARSATSPTHAADRAGFDRVVLDMLAPWEVLDLVGRRWCPAGC